MPAPVAIPAPAPKPEPINNSKLVEAFRAEGGEIYHLRPDNILGRGITFAYKQKRNRIEIATAVQHGDDDFTKKIGTKTAIERFNAGRTIFLPLARGNHAVHFLRMFRHIL